jgi:hypothetical protein
MLRRGAAGFFAAVVLSCGGHTSSRSDDPGLAAQAHDLAEARRLIDAKVPLPARGQVVALIDAIAAAALQEGAGARAAQLYAVSARLAERLWRIEGDDKDAARALDLYKGASLDSQLPGACESARAAACLAGERAHDAARSRTPSSIAWSGASQPPRPRQALRKRAYKA